MNMLKTIAVGIGAVILATSIFSTTASAASVAPKAAALRLANKTPGACPADGKVRLYVTAKSEGWVQVRIQRQSDNAISPPMVLTVGKNLNYGKAGIWNNDKFLAKMVWTPTFPGPYSDKFRIIASGAGKSKTSSWSELIVTC